MYEWCEILNLERFQTGVMTGIIGIHQNVNEKMQLRQRAGQHEGLVGPWPFVYDEYLTVCSFSLVHISIED